jgi:hypothetical protein
MNSYLYAINYKNLIHEIEKDNYIHNFLDSHSKDANKETQNSNDYIDTSFAEINSESLSTTTDKTMTSLPSSLNLIPITNFTSSPRPLQQELDYKENTSESDDQSKGHYNMSYVESNPNFQSKQTYQLPISSIEFIRTYLDKSNNNPSTKKNDSHMNILISTSTLSNESVHDLDNYFNQLSTEEIIETTIEFVNSSTRSFQK